MKMLNLSSRFANDAGAVAARRLFAVSRYNNSDVEVVARFLVGLHNNRLATPDLYLVCRCIADACFDDVITTMRWFRDVDERCDLVEIFGDAGEAVLADLMLRIGMGEKPNF